jgi:hypothetical protein
MTVSGFSVAAKKLFLPTWAYCDGNKLEMDGKERERERAIFSLRHICFLILVFFPSCLFLWE